MPAAQQACEQRRPRSIKRKARGPACCRLLLVIAAEREDIILRPSSSHVAPSMFFAGRDVSHRAGFQGHAAPHDSDLESALVENNHFFMHMMVRRMRRF